MFILAVIRTCLIDHQSVYLSQTKASVCKGYKLKIADQYDTDGKKVHIDKPLIVRSMIERGELVASFIIATSIAYNEPVMTYLLHTAFGNSSYGDILISGNQEAYNVDELDGILQGLRLENDRKEEEKRGGKQALRILRGLTGVVSLHSGSRPRPLAGLLIFSSCKKNLYLPRESS